MAFVRPTSRAEVRPPDPAGATTLDDLVARLRLLKAWAGDRPYTAITDAVNGGWKRAGRPAGELTTRSTVAGYFTLGRRRLDEELLVAIVRALHDDAAYAERWRRALMHVRGETVAAALVDARKELPPGIPDFVGRDRELRRVTELAALASPCRAVVIRGMPGVGKTSLALRAAHHLVGRGRLHRVRLFADLRGCAPTGPPADPGAVLGDFLRLLGLRGDEIPATLDGRIDRYRHLLRDQDALVVLDDAAPGHHVEALLPTGARSFTIITSRYTLPGLARVEEVPLGPLRAHEALSMLGRIAGHLRLGADPGIVRRIAASVGHLPLAVAVIGEHLGRHPDWLLADYLKPLPALVLAGGLRDALAASERHLPAETRRVLRLLALNRREVDSPAAAALVGLDVETARRHLETLAAAHLLERAAGDAFGFHRMVRAYAIERVRTDEPISQRRAALSRLAEHYRNGRLVH
ncbi:AAA family ATPase [Micromonospora olivasterospora]|uniref:NB-ARC domain-containing protein n=1 Tax=Micromonospora olivasterospora TaxID=1880 RepID=A0A562IHG6_MICOL|nr:AAA family ATPase [Micromonospora olivasterospora]TWH70390.1 hypothetical protein JD77_05415 [Micromonospora olivasterospora]